MPPQEDPSKKMSVAMLLHIIVKYRTVFFVRGRVVELANALLFWSFSLLETESEVQDC
jgi:hypothetical protein